MTNPTDRADLDKLIADVLEHARRMSASPWRKIWPVMVLSSRDEEMEPSYGVEGPCDGSEANAIPVSYEEDADGIALYRSAAPQLATALRDALDSQLPDAPPRYETEIVEGVYSAYRDHRIQNEPTPPSLWPPEWRKLDQERRARFFAVARHVVGLCWAWHVNAQRAVEHRADALDRERVASDELDKVRGELRDALDRERAMQEALKDLADKGKLSAASVLETYARKLEERRRGR